MFFEGDKNRKLRDEGTQRGEQVNSTLVEFAMNALVALRKAEQHDTLRYLYDAALSGETTSALPEFLSLDSAGMLPAGEGTIDIAGASALVTDDNRHLRREAYPIILAALVPQDDGRFHLRNPLDLNDKNTQILEAMTARAYGMGFNTGPGWRDLLDSTPGTGR